MKTRLSPDQLHEAYVNIANDLAEWIDHKAPKDLEIHAVYAAHVLLCDLINQLKPSPPRPPGAPATDP